MGHRPKVQRTRLGNLVQRTPPPAGEVALLEVNNALGQKVIVEENIIGNGIKSIPLTSTSNGFYFIRLLVNGSSRNQ